MRLAAGCAGLLTLAIALAQGTDTQVQGQGKWVDSFNAVKENIRPLDATARKACEGQLHQILTALDDHAACATDADCTLVDQEPFGNTVPVRADSANAVLSDMKRFARSCDTHFSHSVRHPEAVSVPACVQNRCMVRVSFKPCDSTPSASQATCKH